MASAVRTSIESARVSRDITFHASVYCLIHIPIQSTKRIIIPEASKRKFCHPFLVLLRPCRSESLKQFTATVFFFVRWADSQ